jgi:SAM-dependent methyltransferase
VKSAYDAIARLYDPWSRGVVEDVGFYVEEASRFAPGPVVELGVGTGRIAIPIAAAGTDVIGIDSSEGMLSICQEQASLAGLSSHLDLRLGDYLRPPIDERVPLVLCPFRAYLHLHTDAERLEALSAARELLTPGGRLVFDVFAPGRDDIDETNGRWLEREPGIFERADWDESTRTLVLSLRGLEHETTMTLSWISTREWADLLDRAGFQVDACYGWFDRRVWAGQDDSIWIAAKKPDE